MGESLRTLFGVGTLSGLTDGQLLERFARRGGGSPTRRSRRRPSRRWWSDTGRWCWASAGRCWAIGMTRRTPARRPSWSWRGRPDRSGGGIRWRAGSTAWPVGWPCGPVGRPRGVASWSAGGWTAIKAEEPVSAPPAEPWPELYEELDRLPQPFRAAVVLCDLEGHSYEQAAGLLHCPVGTVQSRLARGRERLRRRLERRGLSLGRRPDRHRHGADRGRPRRPCRRNS